MSIRGDRLVAVAWLLTIAAFVAFAWAVHGSATLWFDERPTEWVQDLRGQDWASDLFGFANTMGHQETVACVALVMVVLLAAQGLWTETALVLGAAVMRVLQLAIRNLIDRPFSWDSEPDSLETFPTGDSFPSGHYFGEVLVYGLLFAFADRIVRWTPGVVAVRALCVFVIAVGGPARMYTGAHWPSDVVGSALLALAYLIPAVWIATSARRPHRLRDSPRAVTEGSRVDEREQLTAQGT
jgi:undecaprenyl-diphosphatase